MLLKKVFSRVSIVSFLLLCPLLKGGAEEPQFLDISQRPARVSEHVDKSFEFLEKQDTSRWGIANGAETYLQFRIHEHELIKKIILSASYHPSVSIYG